MRLDMSCLDGAAASARAEVAELGCVVDALDSCRVVGVRRAQSTDPPRRVRSAELLVEAPPTAFAMPQVENVRAPKAGANPRPAWQHVVEPCRALRGAACSRI
jgi:hypothetical protein